jgi:hypothetical protein
MFSPASPLLLSLFLLIVQGTDDQMSQREVYEFNVPTFGKGVVYDVDHK